MGNGLINIEYGFNKYSPPPIYVHRHQRPPSYAATIVEK